MITGIYNLPKEFCLAVGESLSLFLLSEAEDDLFELDFNNAYSIISVGSKMMIGEIDLNFFGTLLKISSVWTKVSSADSDSLLSSFFITGFRLKVFVTVTASKAMPNFLQIHAWRE